MRIRLKTVASLTSLALALPLGASSASRELTIKNFDAQGPACVVRVADETPCASESCLVALPARSRFQPVQLHFVCLPMSAPTGFENPPPEVEWHGIRAKNAQGHLSLTEFVEPPYARQTRQLDFCLWGQSNVLCGNAMTMKATTRLGAEQQRAIKKFINAIELADPFVK